jgi:hypothetical protein
LNAPSRSFFFGLLLAGVLVPSGCQTAESPTGGALSEQAVRWLERSQASYRAADLDDARDAAQSALTNAPNSPEVKAAAARVHLARLEFAEAKRLLQGVQTSEALSIRGRANWYAGDLDAAAEDLENLLADAKVKDEWAKAISRLARQGSGRKPFQVSGGLLATMPLQRIRSAHLIVPVEINGEPALALVATSRGEMVLDSATRKDPSWVQLRFGERVEVRDVPALVEDLSGISKEVGAPIKALLGVNLLRRLNVTFDFQGEQFVVRTREASPPPRATRVSLAYAQGGAMLTRVLLRSGLSDQSVVQVNTLMPYPMALDERGLKVAGVDPNSLQSIPTAPQVKGGKLPFLRIGAFDLPDVPVVNVQSFGDLRDATGVDVVGAVGAGLVALFRCTFSDGGRTLWLEDDMQIVQMMQQSSQPGGPGPGPNGPPPGGPSPGGPAPTAPAPTAPAPAPAPAPNTLTIPSGAAPAPAPPPKGSKSKGNP